MSFHRSKKVWPVILLTAACGLLPVYGKSNGLGGSPIPLASVPVELQGANPIHMPEYDGVEQLLVLSDRWVILVVNTMQELFEEIDRLSDGQLRQVTDRWTSSQQAGRPDWKSYRDRWKIRDKFIADARENIGERTLGHP